MVFFYFLNKWGLDIKTSMTFHLMMSDEQILSSCSVYQPSMPGLSSGYKIKWLIYILVVRLLKGKVNLLMS